MLPACHLKGNKVNKNQNQSLNFFKEDIVWFVKP